MTLGFIPWEQSQLTCVLHVKKTYMALPEVELALVGSTDINLVSVDLECHSTDSFNREVVFIPYASDYTVLIVGQVLCFSFLLHL